ncbi:hypothetical protein ACF8SB_07190 [Pseudomonas sp. CJQ_8]|uniref:hypothetical protein n=1 Tax=Pseudomonas sp. CJQ_8 TaxID=3367167 RepID=UPI00370C2FEC
MSLPIGTPQPDEADSGVTGNQEAGPLDEVVATSAPLDGRQLANTLLTIIAGNPEHFGGAYTGPLLSAHLGDSYYDKGQSRLQLTALQRQLDQAKAQIHKLELANVRMEERIAGAVVRVWIQKCCAFASPIAAGLAFEASKSETGGWKGLALLAAVLFLASVIPDLRKRHDKQSSKPEEKAR